MYHYHKQQYDNVRGFEDDPTSEGSFKRASGDILYSWEPNEDVARKNKRDKVLKVLVSIALVLASVLPISYFVRMTSEVIKETVGVFEYPNLTSFVFVFLVVVVLASVSYEVFGKRQRRSSTFVDIDEGASSRRFEREIIELRNNIQQLKLAKDSDPPKPLEEVKATDGPKEFHEYSAIEQYIHGVTKSLEGHIELSDKKASKLLDTGTMYLRRGIYFYVASILVWQVVAHVWGVDKQLIFGVVSCSLTFLVVEFLAAWFLKQYRSFIDSSVQFMRVKSVFERYLLSYYAVKEFSDAGAEQLAESKAQVLKVLAEEIKWPEPFNSKASDMNHMVQMFESLTGMLEKVKLVSAKGEAS